MINVNEMARKVAAEIELSETELNWTKEHGLISWITDCEGDWIKYKLQKARNEALIKELKLKYPELQSVKTTFIYGGDVTDKSEGNIQILLDLRATRLSSGKTLFISGNRDVNKIRLIEALSPTLQAKFSTLDSEYVYWANGTSPKAWVG